MELPVAVRSRPRGAIGYTQNDVVFAGTGSCANIANDIIMSLRWGNRFRLAISAEAEGDLARIEAEDPDTADDTRATLEWIQNDQTLLQRLNEHGYGKARVGNEANAAFSVSKWVETWRGANPRALWRLKIWDLEDLGLRYRVIYAYQIESRCFWILGIVKRDFDYDTDHETSKRIFAQADKLGKGDAQHVPQLGGRDGD